MFYRDLSNQIRLHSLTVLVCFDASIQVMLCFLWYFSIALGCGFVQ